MIRYIEPEITIVIRYPYQSRWYRLFVKGARGIASLGYMYMQHL